MPNLPRARKPVELKRWIDEQGVLTAWPAKLRTKLAVLGYLVGLFQPGRTYTEREVDSILVQCLRPGISDHAHVRRALCDYGFLYRERDGSRYWRPDADQAQQHGGLPVGDQCGSP